ncbi:MAG: thioredoxin family protein, partial [Pedobacter sp.]|nr:thioredoxin family protein [Pedobacter sp.]
MVNYSNIFVNEGLSYLKYRDLVSSLLENNKTTGGDHSEAMLQYSKLNVQRMNRVDKTTVLNEELTAAVGTVNGSYSLLVISEGWCGDAAQLVPVFQKIADLAPEQFELKLILRDTNLPLIDAHLTN